jgi:hypothetical protein
MVEEDLVVAEETEGRVGDGFLINQIEDEA